MKTTFKNLKLRSLSLAVALGLSTIVCQSAYADDNDEKNVNAYQEIGDLEIYKAAEEGKVSIIMMLDTSGSMEERDGLRETRMQRLKNAMNALMDSTDLKADKVSIGIGQFSTQSNDRNILLLRGAYGNADNRTGKILVPTAPLDDAQRQKIKTAVANLVSNGGTPSAMAYAEAGAYMLGTTTKGVNKNYYEEWQAFRNQRWWYQQTVSSPSGFDFSVAESKAGAKYKSPIIEERAECDGQGIYFLTDGQPNSSIHPEDTMKIALGDKSASFNKTNTLPEGLDRNHGTPEVGAFARALRVASTNPNHKNTPYGVSIRTAVVGFGSVFDTSQYPGVQVKLPLPKLDKHTSLPIGSKQEDFVEGKFGDYFDCRKIPAGDARNACNWGAKSHPSLPGVGGFGEGGFYSAQSTQDVISSVKKFLGDLNNDIAASPSGTISIPRDPLNASTIQPYAYVPMIQSYVGKENAVWDGNLKKYHTLYGTLYGQNSKRLYKVNAEKATTENKTFPVDIDADTRDIWQNDTGKGDSVTAGGTRSQIVSKDTKNATSNTSRIVYIEGKDNFVKVQVVGGVLKFNDQNATQTTIKELDYTFEDMTHLLDYLGFVVPKNLNNYTGRTDVERYTTFFNTLKNTKIGTNSVFGGVSHSVPVLAAYRGRFDPNTGNIHSTEGREDFILYGTMEGSLRMTDAKTGEETFAFIPRTIFEKQREALASGAKRDKIGTPYFGVDAPWAISASYNYTEKDDKGNDTGVVAETVNATKMHAYGGLRMGGEGIYGLDISDKTPKKLFSITDKTSGFERLGQTWAKPTIAKIKTGKTDKEFKEVLIFGGGYDMCYENPRFKLEDKDNEAGHMGDANIAACVNKTHAKGNAIYMVSAENGELLASWSSDSSAPGQASEMKHSIVSEIVTLDRNNNGFVDSIYASDLGGQLFRIDLKEGANTSSMTRRVVRVFNANDGDLPATAPNLRFYEKPSVSFYDHNGGTLAMVNIASGDRSSPLHKHRDELTESNRIYGIIDRDLTTFRIGQQGVETMKSQNLTHEDLHAYDPAELASNNAEKVVGYIEALKTTDETKWKHGWWYPMTRFDRYTEVKHLKAIGSSMVSGSIFYTSVYNPEYQYTKDVQCSAKIVGATERQMFCLPWGICANTDPASDGYGSLIAESKNGTLGFAKAGPGIQELAMATITATEDESTSFKTFISQQSISERIADSKNTNGVKPLSGDTNIANKGDSNSNYGTNHSNIEPGALDTDMNKRLTVDRWYDLASAESNQ